MEELFIVVVVGRHPLGSSNALISATFFGDSSYSFNVP